MLELGKDLLDRVQVGRVFRQEKQLGAGRADQPANGLTSVTAKIIDDDDVAGTKCGEQHLVEIDLEALAVDRPLDQPWCLDPIMAQRRQEGRGVPAALRDL